VLEKTIERKACDYASSRGWINFKFTSPTCRGVPDRIFVKGGIILFIEFKAPSGVASQAQHLIIKMLNSYGANALIIDNLKDFKAVLQNAKI